MPFFPHDGIDFFYHDEGGEERAIAFLFQHGLGGDSTQPAGLFRPPPGFRLLCLDARGHGRTRPLGDPRGLAFATFADDLAAFLDHLGVERAVLGGISLGAAVALRFTLRFPARVLALVLSRPAWLAGPNERNARLYARIARLLREHGREEGRRLFAASPEYREVLALSSDAASSLLGQFENPRAEDALARLERLPLDAPLYDLRDLETVEAPTLVLATRRDPIHPNEYGEEIARRIPGARFVEVTPKSISREAHAADLEASISTFLDERHKELSLRRARHA
jgi:pimeloyl-ACP methyl ester carboxylesterase